jgi:hypothetical protein
VATRRRRAGHDSKEQAVTLTEFLLARYDEDESAVRATLDRIIRTPDGTSVGDAFARWGERVLADVRAHRRIVRALESAEVSSGTDYELGFGLHVAACAIAAVYADHPDYRQEWKP